MYCTVVQDTDGEVDEEMLTRLETAIRDNNTLQKLRLSFLFPISANVAEAILKGAAHNKGLKSWIITVPDAVELHKLEGEVKQQNKRLRLYVYYHKVRNSLYCVYVSVFNVVVCQ